MPRPFYFRRKRLPCWLLGIILALALLALGIWFTLFRLNRFYLTVQLQGDSHITLEYGETYQDPGVKVILRGTRFWQVGFTPENIDLQTTGTLREDTPGVYTLTYHAAFRGLTAQSTRTVTIADTQAPTITLAEDAEPLAYPYEESGFTAWDNYDGDLTAKVLRTEEPGLVSYTVTDSSGNTTTVHREVPTFDPMLPRIFLEGTETYTITVGTQYEEPGYRAVDNGEEDITALVLTSGEVDWLTPGSYPITYTVTDADENTTVATRTVEVTAKPRPKTVCPEEKTVYLTFDDGPGPYTLTLLDVLDRYNAKATFFVVDAGDPDLLREIVRRGHSIGIHSVTHNYREIYASPEAFFRDLHAMQDIIYEQTGVLTTLMRFPGGSSNTVSRHTCEGIMTTLSQAVQDAGFQYFDWNVDSNDAGGAQKRREVRDNVIEGLQNQPISLVLQHDIHPYSVDAVEEILQWGQDNGYTFKPLRENSPGFHHEVQN